MNNNSHSPITVLMVDDDEDDYILTLDLLTDIESGDYQLDWISKYDNALAEIQKQAHDVYLIDYRLRKRNGVDLIRQAVQLGCKAPLIVMTGQGDREIDLEAMQAGAADYLVKGQFDANMLERVIRYNIRQKQAQEALLRERDRIITIEEDIRKHLARDLHDGPAQLIAAMINTIDFINMLYQQAPERVPDELESLNTLAHRVLHQVRTLLFDLRPVILETQGLVPALQTYAKNQQETSNEAYHLKIEGCNRRFNTKGENTIFSIIQEAMGNVKKHAQAQDVWILLVEKDDNLQVSIQDNGQGFDVKQLQTGYDKTGSLGMLNMQERAQAIGGSLTITSQPNIGTTVSLLVPLSMLE